MPFPETTLHIRMSEDGKLDGMLTQFPKAVLEIPVSNVEKAAEYYINALGFHFDWGNDERGVRDISQKGLPFLTNPVFRKTRANNGTIMTG